MSQSNFKKWVILAVILSAMAIYFVGCGSGVEMGAVSFELKGAGS